MQPAWRAWAGGFSWSRFAHLRVEARREKEKEGKGGKGKGRDSREGTICRSGHTVQASSEGEV